MTLGGTLASPKTPVSEAETVISIRNLRVVRGGNTILHDISLDVPRGTVYGLVGPSGSGKTTFIRSIIGRQQIHSGEISIDGLAAGSSELRGRIGYMPQETAVYADLTGRENFEFFAAVYRVKRSRIDEVIDLLDMRQTVERPITTYSGGQRLRISLGIALLASPAFLLLDEPTVGLDPDLRNRLWTGFSQSAAAGTTLLVSTHVMDEAARADRLAFFADGRIVADGTPDDLMTRAGAANLEEALLVLTRSGRDA